MIRDVVVEGDGQGCLVVDWTVEGEPIAVDVSYGPTRSTR